MTSATSVEVHIAADVHTVYSEFLCVENYPDFIPEVAAVEDIGPDVTRWIIDLGGARREFQTTVTKRVEDERVAWVVSDDRAHRGLAQFEESTPGRATLTVASSWEPEGILERAEAIFGLDTRTIRGALEHFASYVEGLVAEREAEGQGEREVEGEGHGEAEGEVEAKGGVAAEREADGEVEADTQTKGQAAPRAQEAGSDPAQIADVHADDPIDQPAPIGSSTPMVPSTD